MRTPPTSAYPSQVELGQSDLSPVFPLDEVDIEFFEMLEADVSCSEAVPTQRPTGGA